VANAGVLDYARQYEVLTMNQPAPDIETDSERHGRADMSMHDGVEVSCDCCSCEAEPYWLEAFAEETEEL